MTALQRVLTLELLKHWGVLEKMKHLVFYCHWQKKTFFVSIDFFYNKSSIGMKSDQMRGKELYPNSDCYLYIFLL